MHMFVDSTRRRPSSRRRLEPHRSLLLEMASPSAFETAYLMQGQLPRGKQSGYTSKRALTRFAWGAGACALNSGNLGSDALPHEANSGSKKRRGPPQSVCAALLQMLMLAMLLCMLALQACQAESERGPSHTS